ncbi:flavodoxin [Nocardioides sp. GCM10028917]|uniref:flavodoxin n=1 Tax=Nocardioides sp. GCM10028917 TaxID=3273408 RepID=UPI0036172CCB
MNVTLNAFLNTSVNDMTGAPSRLGISRELHRRTVLRGGLLGGALAMVTACSTDTTPDPGGETTAGSPTPDPDTDASSSPTRASSDGARVLVVYYSRPGENYYYGDRTHLEVGNTEVLTDAISRRLDELGVDHDVHRLEAVEAYPDDYDATVARNVREQDDDARPPLIDPLESITAYDVVLVGSPIWNVRPPMLMHTFAEAHDFTGKTVHPFVTYAVSGLGTAVEEYEAACPGADVGEGLAVRGETVREDAPAAVTDWVARMDLPASRS